MLQKSKRCHIKGAILAGGNASRMGGILKGFLKDGNGQPIIFRLIHEMRQSGIKDIVIVANDPLPYLDMDMEIIPDLRKGIGPIAGIEASLLHFTGQCDGVLFVPCDVPNITAKELMTLKDGFIDSEAGVVLAETEVFFWHPLCAVVHNDIASQISSAIDHGQRKVQRLWKQLGAVTVKFDDEAAFTNINSFSDINRLQENKYEKKNLCGRLVD